MNILKVLIPLGATIIVGAIALVKYPKKKQKYQKKDRALKRETR
jgi:hypothetical protein